MLVIDASALVTALVDDGEYGAVMRRRLVDQELRAPEIVDLEVVSALRQLVARGNLMIRRADFALRDLMQFPVKRISHRPYLPRCWELRNNVTAYDAAYVAIAEATSSTLLTTDARLSSATGPRCAIEVLSRLR